MSWEGFSRVFEYLMVAVVLVALWALQRRSQRRKAASAGDQPRAAAVGAQSVTVTTGGAPLDPERVRALGERLKAAVQAAGAGSYEGQSLSADGGATFTLSGPDADRIFAAVAPVLRAEPMTAAGTAILRSGAPGDPQATERRIAVGGP